jgi:hypothetical protein
MMALPMAGCPCTSVGVRLDVRTSDTFGGGRFREGLWGSGGGCPCLITLLIRRIPLFVVAGGVCTMGFFNLLCKRLVVRPCTSSSSHALRRILFFTLSSAALSFART